MVITPRNANKLRKAKQQLSGTATASNKSRFMAMSPVSGFAPDLILARLVVRTTPSKKFAAYKNIGSAVTSQLGMAADYWRA